jgi:CheY-like chemotaxis protein
MTPEPTEPVGRLADGVAHELNNLMSAVVGFSDLVLARLEIDHPLRTYVEDIKRAGERASSMTKQLLVAGLPQTAALTDAPDETKTPPSGLPRGSETILIVEDEELVRHLEREVLKLCGYSVLEASTPDAALDVIRSHGIAIDLLLTDVMLPGMSGFTLADSAAELGCTGRILFTSVHSEEWMSRQGPMAAAAAFIAKPFTPTSLARRVREMLDEPTGQTAQAVASAA